MPKQRLNPIFIELIGVRFGLVLPGIIEPEATRWPGRKLGERWNLGRGLDNYDLSNQPPLQIRAELPLAFNGQPTVGRLRRAEVLFPVMHEFEVELRGIRTLK